MSRSRSRKSTHNRHNISMNSAGTFLGSKRATREFAKADNYTIRSFAKKNNLPGMTSSKQVLKTQPKPSKISQTLYYNIGLSGKSNLPLHKKMNAQMAAPNQNQDRGISMQRDEMKDSLGSGSTPRVNMSRSSHSKKDQTIEIARKKSNFNF